jgi:triacylglycerol lipase
MKKALLIFISTLIGLISCQSIKPVKETKQCATKYPILLVHGIGFRDDFLYPKYWSKIPKVLKKNGAKVYLAHQDAFNSHAENAVQIKYAVDEILEETGAEKVNIIAHSKGGLESRYAITMLGMANKVASLTTLATPHRGSAMADTLLAFFERKNMLDWVLKKLFNYAKFLGDKHPDIYQASNELSIAYMKHFNQSVPDIPTVYYQSYGGLINEKYPNWFIRIQYKLMVKAEGENDCIVSKHSYQWGKFKGVVKSNDDYGISHFDIVGMRFVSQASSFDANYFFIELAKDLKAKGF